MSDDQDLGLTKVGTYIIIWHHNIFIPRLILHHKLLLPVNFCIKYLLCRDRDVHIKATSSYSLLQWGAWLALLPLSPDHVVIVMTRQTNQIVQVVSVVLKVWCHLLVYLLSYLNKIMGIQHWI